MGWVSRRLQLPSGLPDAALAAVRGGQLSSWAANRVIVSLARANPEHAERLLAMLATSPLSSRELWCWFEHYQQPSAALANTGSTDRACSSIPWSPTLGGTPARGCGPAAEGECIDDLRCLEAVIARLRKRVATLCQLPARLVAAAPRLRAAIDALTRELEREDTHDPGRDRRRGARSASAGARPARDQPPTGDVAQHGAAESA